MTKTKALEIFKSGDKKKIATTLLDYYKKINFYQKINPSVVAAKRIFAPE